MLPVLETNRKLQEGQQLDLTPTLSQIFYFEADRLVREVVAGRHSARSWIAIGRLPSGSQSSDPAKAWSIARLQGVQSITEEPSQQPLRIVDLFCGGGGFSAGLKTAAEAVGMHPEFAAAVDLDEVGLEVFAKNLRPRSKLRRNVDALLDYALRFQGDRTSFAYPPEVVEPVLADEVGRVHVVVGGPPCQGHSNLNNHTRRVDPRNLLYLTVPAMAFALGAEIVVIENVQAVLKDDKRVVHKARSILENEYHVQEAVLEADRLGVAQQRKRHFLIATKRRAASIQEIYTNLRSATLSCQDAIFDLISKEGAGGFDSGAELSAENRDRIRFLFEHDLYNLPNEERPDCHKDGHTYPSVYGRLYADRPAQTITGGFLSPGRGRYVHPCRPRGLTPHEGARLQGFADDYLFERTDGQALTNKDYSKLIGDAVPPPLGYAIGLACISSI